MTNLVSIEHEELKTGDHGLSTNTDNDRRNNSLVESSKKKYVRKSYNVMWVRVPQFQVYFMTFFRGR